MIEIVRTILSKEFPQCKNPKGLAAGMQVAIDEFEINTPARICNFMAQTAYESGQFNSLVENLNYKTPARLKSVFSSRFKDEQATYPYLGQPEKLANYVYARRMGNGDTNSGDGFKYRGRGIIQLTGRSNYESAEKALKLDIVNHPEKLQDIEDATISAAWFWKSRGLNELADDETDDDDVEDFTKITRLINGGVTGIRERIKMYDRIMQAYKKLQ